MTKKLTISICTIFIIFLTLTKLYNHIATNNLTDYMQQQGVNTSLITNPNSYTDYNLFSLPNICYSFTYTNPSITHYYSYNPLNSNTPYHTNYFEYYNNLPTDESDQLLQTLSSSQ